MTKASRRRSAMIHSAMIWSLGLIQMLNERAELDIGDDTKEFLSMNESEFSLSTIRYKKSGQGVFASNKTGQGVFLSSSYVYLLIK
jgi:hypothetical protein